MTLERSARPAVRRWLAVAVPGLLITLGSTPDVTAQMCTQVSNGCTNGVGYRICTRSFSYTGPAIACASSSALSPADSAGVYMTGMFRPACKSNTPVLSAGSCVFVSCGACGTLTVDMVAGLPVELMDFEIEEGTGHADPSDAGGDDG